MSTLAQTADGDLAITAGKQLSVIADPVASAAQTLQNKFRRFLGEWFLDTREGIPYFDIVFVKNPDLGAIRQTFLAVILGTPPIVKADLVLALDRPNRRLNFSFVATADTGQTITGGDGQPFIVSGAPQ